MPDVLVIADDLTGALDSGVAFAGAGRRVSVARRVEDLPEVLAGAPDVAVVSTGTREADAATARARMAEVIAALDPASVRLVLKKVDSRLKGPVGAEVGVLSKAMPGRRPVAVPAIPAMDRVQAGGQLTGMGIDTTIDIAARFDGPVDVPDVQSDADLDAIVAARSDALWIGARGLAFALARALYGAAGGGPMPPPAHPFLLAVGSRDPITLAQVEHLSHRVAVHAAPDGRVARVPPAAPVLAVQLTDGGMGRAPAAAGADFAEGIAGILRQHRPAALLASGGETANAILDRLGIGTLDILSEIAPGLPVCEARAPWGILTVMTKSGGFGGPGLLAEIAGQGAPADMWETTR